jgi:hypothetical protein
LPAGYFLACFHARTVIACRNGTFIASFFGNWQDQRVGVRKRRVE